MDLEKDLWLLWATYDLGGFSHIERKLDQQAFTDEILRQISFMSNVWIIEDDCPWFEAKHGPVALLGVLTDGHWKVEPHFEFFQWASARLRLRAMVFALQWIPKDKRVAVCILRSPERFLPLLRHVVQKYRMGYFVGRITSGIPPGEDEFIYAMSCSKIRHKEKE
jgi:hypothetical protein